MCGRYGELLAFAQGVEKDYLVLQQQFKDFIDSNKGFGGNSASSYVLRSCYHGLVVGDADTSEPDKILQNAAEERANKLNQFSAVSKSTDFYPEEKDFPYPFNTPLKDSQKRDTKNLIPVKLIRPLDADVIGNSIETRLPEVGEKAFVLTLTDFT